MKICIKIFALGLSLLPVQALAQTRSTTMKPVFTQQAQQERESLKLDLGLDKNNPELAERYYNFALAEVVAKASEQLDPQTRLITNLAVLMGSQGVDLFRQMMPAALEAGVTPEQVREVVYQGVDYLGMSRVYPFVQAMDEVFKARGVKLPLAPQATTTPETRLQKGNQAQIDIFGERMRENWKTSPAETAHINEWLASNCFGDYYTRGTLDLQMRELITFCYIYAQGGCEPQLRGHIAGNLNMGNTREKLIAVISANIPLIGYPRTLNALTCINEMTTQNKSKDEGKNLLFPQGDLNTAYAKYFIGNSYLATLATGEGKLRVANVTFEPRCRNNWHIHHGSGQILICVSGRGWYQEEGKPARELHPGDVVDIPAEAKHWHGAAKDSWFQHIALSVPGGTGTTWLEQVVDEEYDKLK